MTKNREEEGGQKAGLYFAPASAVGVDEFFDPEDIISRNAVKTAERDQVLDRQLALAAFVFAVLLLPCMQNESYLLLRVAVFDSQLL